MKEAPRLSVSIGEFSDRGAKEINQDFHDVFIPTSHLLTTKGIAIAIADGISSSSVSQIASKTAVTSFLIDYFSTSELWSVQKSATRVLSAINSWLLSQSQKNALHYDLNRGYVCTLSAMILRSHTAHIFHIGDTRIYRLRAKELTCLTQDHRSQNYLSRAMGITQEIYLDYETHRVLEEDIYIFMSDGVYEHIEESLLVQTILDETLTLQEAAKKIAQIAYDNDSSDNLTIQIVRVETLPLDEIQEIDEELFSKPLPPLLNAGEHFDGYTITRTLSATPRSHIYKAVDDATQTQVVIKIPSIDLRDDQSYLERFCLEEWIARRMQNPYLLKAHPQTREKNYLYSVSEFVEGETLAQWMRDNPKCSLASMRDIAKQLGKGLQSMHRQELIHQDLRPQNILIDQTQSIKIIDYGSVKVAGIAEINTLKDQNAILGTMLYSAPEYFLGEVGTSRCDIFSLGVVLYEMLSGEFPYGVALSKATSRAQQKRIKYNSLYRDEIGIPLWVDASLKKALAIDPNERYSEVSEFIYDLEHPNERLLKEHKVPLVERNPLLLWKSSTFSCSSLFSFSSLAKLPLSSLHYGYSQAGATLYLKDH